MGTECTHLTSVTSTSDSVIPRVPCQWRNTQAAADGYGTGIEPGTNFPNPRSFEERNGSVVSLQPGATWQAAVTLEIHADEAAAELAKARIAVLQGGTPTVLYAEPMPDWYHA